MIMWRLLIRQPVGGIPKESSGGNPGEHYYYNQSILALLTEYNYYTYSCNIGDPAFYTQPTTFITVKIIHTPV